MLTSPGFDWNQSRVGSIEMLQTAVSTLDEDFDASTFLASATENLSLEELRGLLESQIAEKRVQLVQATNRDYSAFVTLSAALDGTHDALLNLRAPTADAVQSLRSLQSSLERQQIERKNGYNAMVSLSAKSRALEHYADALEAYALAERLALECERVGTTTRVTSSGPPLASSTLQAPNSPEEEALLGGLDVSIVPTPFLPSVPHLGEGDSEGSGSGLVVLVSPSGVGEGNGGPEAQSGLLWRASRAIRSAWISLSGCDDALGKDAAQGQGEGEGCTASTVASLRHRVAGYTQASLRPALVACTLACVDCAGAGRGELALRYVLSAWAELGPGGASTAQACVADSIVRPALQAALAPARLQGSDGVRGPVRRLPRVLDSVLAMVGAGQGNVDKEDATSPALPLLSPLLHAADCVPGYDILTACLWSPLVGVLTGPALAPLLMSPSAPASFHAAYSCITTAYARLRLAGAAFECVPALEYPSSVHGEPLGSFAGMVGAPTSSPGTAASSLLDSEATSALAAAWQPKLALYAQLRAAELGGRLAKALASKVPVAGVVEASAPSICITLPLSDVLGPGCASSEDAGRAWAALLRVAQAAGVPLHESSLHSAGSVNLLLPVSAATWSALSSAWSPQAFLPPLLGHTAALCCAILGRYGAWLTAGAAVGAARSEVAVLRSSFNLPAPLPAVGSEGSRATPPPPGSAGAGAHSGMTQAVVSFTSQQVLHPLPSSYTRGLTPDIILNVARGKAGAGAGAASGVSLPPAPVAGAGLSVPSRGDGAAGRGLTITTNPAEADAIAWSEAAVSCDTLLCAAQDACALAAAATALVGSAGMWASGRAREADTGEAVQACASLLRPTRAAAASVQACVPYLLAVCEAVVARACCTALLSGVRGVPTAYRVGVAGAPRGLPRTHSTYVSGALKPLKAFLGHSAWAVIDASAHADGPRPGLSLTASVCCALLSTMQDALLSALAGVQAMEASLGWLKGGADAGLGRVSEGDKICAQLWLDVRAVGREVAGVLPSLRLTVIETEDGAGGTGVGLAISGGQGTAAGEAVVAAYALVACKVKPFGGLARQQ